MDARTRSIARGSPSTAARTEVSSPSPDVVIAVSTLGVTSGYGSSDVTARDLCPLVSVTPTVPCGRYALIKPTRPPLPPGTAVAASRADCAWNAAGAYNEGGG